MKYITQAGSQTIATTVNGIEVQLNKALTTETIILAVGGNTFATITGAANAGAKFTYNGLRGQGVLTINPSAATIDVTVSFLNREI